MFSDLEEFSFEDSGSEDFDEIFGRVDDDSEEDVGLP
jgi:hypothetical protein